MVLNKNQVKRGYGLILLTGQDGLILSKLKEIPLNRLLTSLPKSLHIWIVQENIEKFEGLILPLLPLYHAK